MVEEARLRPASGIALQRPVVATLSGQEVGDFDPARGGGFCPANGVSRGGFFPCERQYVRWTCF
jgi:hypothetical protein